MGSLLALLLLAAPAVRPFAEERALLDRRLETLRRILPDGANPGVDVAVVGEMARVAGLSLEVRARAPLETGALGDVPVEVSGTARFAEIERFFRQAALSARLVDVEKVTLAAGPADAIKMTALLHFPFRVARAPLPPPPEGLRVRLSEVTRPVAEAFVRDQSLALAKAEQIAALRRSRRNPRLFLAELAAIARDRPVVLSEAAVGDEFVIRGLTVGEGPMRALEARLERGFFRVSEVLMVRVGACHRFEARGRSPVAGIEAELPLPAADDLFRPDDAPCVVDRDGGPASSLRIPAPKPVRGRAPAPRGPLSLRLRGMDLADVFFVLHRLTGQTFLVDEDVRGRVTVDAAGVTLEDVLALLARADVTVSPGPVRRVSRAPAAVRAPASAATPPGGAEPPASVTPVSLSVKRAAVSDVLAVMAEAEADASPAPAVSGRVSVWAKEARPAELRAAILQAARRGAPSPRAEGAPGTAPERRLAVRADELSLLEFQLAGVASAGGGWLAFAYAPTGVLNAYGRGDRLLDATLAEVQSTDVLLTTEEGPLRLGLPDPPR